MTKLLSIWKHSLPALVSGAHDAATTTLTLQAGEGAKLAAITGDGPQVYLAWWDDTAFPSNPLGDPNYEIVEVTARATDTLTVVRARAGTTASTKNTGGSTYKVAQVMSREDIEKIDREIARDACRARLGADQTGVLDNTWTKVLLDTEDYDYNSNFDISASNHIYTAPRAQVVHVSASVEFASPVADKHYAIRVTKNASTTVINSFLTMSLATAGLSATPTLASSLQLVQNDTLELQAFHNDGTTQTINSLPHRTFFCIDEVRKG